METNGYHCQHSVRWPIRRILIAACAGVIMLTMSVGTVEAQDAAARARGLKLFADGDKAYKAKKFKKAVKLWLAGFQEVPSPMFHYNVAEAYKQLLDCPNTLHYYKRYLGASNKLPPAKRKLHLEKRAQELIDLYSQRCKEGGPGANIVKKPPVKKPPVVKKDDPPEDDPEEDDPEEEDEPSVTKPAFEPTTLNSSFTLGPSRVSDFGTIADDEKAPLLFSLTIAGGYPIQKVGPVNIDVGGLLGLTSVPWEGTAGGMNVSGTALLTSILANAGATYNVTPKLSLRGEFGVGVLIFSGLSEGAPFLPDMMFADAALSSLNIRVAVGASFAITDNITVTALPAVAYSPAPKGLIDDISSLNRFELMFGLGYRM